MKFALITEGVSEYRVVKHILAKYFKDKEPDINQIQPKIVNDKQQTTGGWTEILKYCEREELQDILVENDYLVIQIDSDQSQTKPFNISHTRKDNSVKTVEELHEEIVKKLRSLIKPEILASCGSKIFFAVSVHTIECWLLPFYYTTNHRADIRNCLTTLNVQLKRNNIDALPVKDKNNAKAIRTYETVLKNWKKKSDIEASSRHNIAFHKFIESLKSIEPE